jgi:hypothetical protein
MRKLVLLLFVLASFTVTAFAQQTVDHACTSKEMDKSIPKKVQVSLKAAIKRIRFDEVLAIAKDPQSTLTVEAIHADSIGRPTAYEVFTRDGCRVVCMSRFVD